MARSTPWGAAQSVLKLMRGVSLVSTAGHGGLMIAQGTAKKLLSPEALELGHYHHGYYCYEEDNAISIPIYDCELIRSAFGVSDVSDEQRLDIALRTLSTFHPDYLIKKGVTPSKDEYDLYLYRQEDERRRHAKDPDLVISASRDGDFINVTTADGAQYRMEKEPYKAAQKTHVFPMGEGTPPYPIRALPHTVITPPPAA